jgi:hypothetical protein
MKKNPKKFSKHLAEQCCGSGMFIPDPIFFHNGSRIHIKNLSIFTQKIVSKLLGNMIRVVHTYPGSRGQKGSESRIRIRNTVAEIRLPRRPQQRRQSRRENVSSSGDCCWRRSGYSPAAHPGPQPILTIHKRKIVNVKIRMIPCVMQCRSLNYPKDHVV